MEDAGNIKIVLTSPMITGCTKLQTYCIEFSAVCQALQIRKTNWYNTYLSYGSILDMITNSMLSTKLNNNVRLAIVKGSVIFIC